MHLGKGQTPAIFAQRGSIMNAIIFSKIFSCMRLTRMSSRRKQPRTRFCAQMFYCLAKFFCKLTHNASFSLFVKENKPTKKQLSESVFSVRAS